MTFGLKCSDMTVLPYVLFTFAWLGIIYLYNCLIARTWKRIKLREALVSVVATAFIGVYGEIFLDTLYHLIVGNPLWHYNVLPIHGGYTSAFAPIIWGMLGFHVYLFHDTLRKWRPGVRRKSIALIFSVEALFLEAALTLSSLLFFGQLMYYYYPSDLWHVTTIQNIPFYFICGMVLVRTLSIARQHPYYFTQITLFLLVVIVFMTS